MIGSFITIPWRNRYLLFQMAWRDITVRYKGHALGMCWACLQPALRLLLYYFVFGMVMSSPWGTGEHARGIQLCVMFMGLILHEVCTAALNQGPLLVQNRGVFVKKVVFPMEIISWVSLCTSLFYFFLTLVIWLLLAALFGELRPGGLWYIVPLVFCMTGYYLGLTWLLSAAGVFFRDIGALMSPVTQIVLFASPVFYPISAVPEQLHVLFVLNPLAFMVDSARSVILFAEKLQWRRYGIYTAAGWFLALLGFAFFRRCKGAFADTL
jgi:lipopolysaccharide transport system permease protein